jgi:hypothetical protein
MKIFVFSRDDMHRHRKDLSVFPLQIGQLLSPPSGTLLRASATHDADADESNALITQS